MLWSILNLLNCFFSVKMADWKWGDQFGMDDDEEADEQSDYQRVTFSYHEFHADL